MAGKRKRSDAPNVRAPKKRATKTSARARTTANTGDDAFRFLDLPAELRDHVYTYIMEAESQAYLRSSGHGKPFCKSALTRVNRQLREEVAAVLNLGHTGLIAEVRNFDFSHLITYFNRTDDYELMKLPTTANPNKHKLTIELLFTDRYSLDEVTAAKLQRWLNRLDHPFKKGANVVVNYRLSPSTSLRFRDVNIKSFQFNINTDRKSKAYRAIRTVLNRGIQRYYS